MAEYLQYLADEELVKVKVIGEADFKQSRQSLQHILELRESQVLRGILVDARRMLNGRSELDEFYTFAEQMPRGLRIAILLEDVSYEAQTAEPGLRFMEQVAQQQGVNIRSFIEESAALNWLRL
jgi:hypothetical protein